MSTILNLAQGTPEWLAHRERYRNASETPIVMGKSPWQTPYQLWLEKTGHAEPKQTFPMRRGTELEPVARAAYEVLTGHVMQPLVVVDGEYSASLDGMTFGGDLILEIKCPMKGQDSELWRQIAKGVLPDHYALQVQHQLMVSGAALADVYVFDGRVGMLLQVKPAPELWPTIHQAWDKFMEHIKGEFPPALCERDIRTREDEAWRLAAETYTAAKTRADATAEDLAAAREALVGLVTHPSESGAGVQVTRFWKSGAVEYKRIPELKGVDLEPYRSPQRLETRISVIR